MSLEPTDEQQRVIDEPGNCAVIATPGGGKTFTIAKKIHQILQESKPYQGVIAISYTNKASNELKRRVVNTGLVHNTSFFGTIDSFLIAEIIRPFGRHIFGESTKELEVVDTVPSFLENSSDFNQAIHSIDNLPEEWKQAVETAYKSGIIVLNTVGTLALYIFKQSFACRRYLRAKYKHIFIDEYQDCDEIQHEIFLKLVDIGVIGIAVGDLDQSIYAFAGKSSKWLQEIAESNRFQSYPLSKNHRSHISIIDYSTRFLSPTYIPRETDDIRVWHKFIDGSEIDIAFWINSTIQNIQDHFSVPRNEIAILFRGKRTGSFIHNNLKIAHKNVISTPLDTSSNSWAGLFKNILVCLFDPKETKFELVERYLDFHLNKQQANTCLSLLKKLEKVTKERPSQLIDSIDAFIKIAKICLPNSENDSAKNSLSDVLSSSVYLDSFGPPSEEQIVLMTLHRAKGLEFDVVLHLDLYRWIMPMYNGDEQQDRNLHYVGITRARKCVILVSSSIRHKGNGNQTDAEPSEFLSQHGLADYRLACPY